MKDEKSGEEPNSLALQHNKFHQYRLLSVRMDSHLSDDEVSVLADDDGCPNHVSKTELC